MAPSLDVKDTDEVKDEDESNNPIARSFDEPSAENIMSESDCNIVNATTELNYEDDIKPSVNVKEASYFNIFERGRNLLDKLDVTYQRAFTASEKTSREVRIATHNCTKQKKPSPVASPVASSYESPMTEIYWKMQETILTKSMAGKYKGLITESLYIVILWFLGIVVICQS